MQALKKEKKTVSVRGVKYKCGRSALTQLYATLAKPLAAAW